MNKIFIPSNEAIKLQLINIFAKSSFGLIQDLRLLSYSENLIYYIKLEMGEELIFRLSRPNYNTFEEISAEIEFRRSLDRHLSDDKEYITGFEIQKPITFKSYKTGSNNALVKMLFHNDVSETNFKNELEVEFIATFFKYHKGVEITNKLLDNHIEKIGQLIAKMHKVAKRQNFTLIRKKWDIDSILSDRAIFGYFRNYYNDQALVMAEKKLKKQLKEYQSNQSNYGLIHGDLRAANFLLDSDKITIIDFDDSGYSWYLFDLAPIFSFNEEKPETKAQLKKLIKGYLSEQKLSEKEINLIPSFLLLRRLQILAWQQTRKETALAQQLVRENYHQKTIKLANDYLQNQGLFRKLSLYSLN